MTLEKTLPVAPVQPFVPLPSLPLDQIILGDNCEVMRTLPSESIDLVVTSPPYDDLRTYGGHAWDFYGVAWNLKRLLKPGGVIVWVVADQTREGSETGSSAEQAKHFRDVGLRQHDTMIYARNNVATFDPRNKRYKHAWEYAFVFAKGEPKTANLIKDKPTKKSGSTGVTVRNPDGSMRTPKDVEFEEVQVRFNIWSYGVGFGQTTKDVSAYEHPAMFPEALARDHILSWSNEGDIVLDPFSGSGTTAKMAKHNGRRFIGIEVNPEYVEISQQRLAQGVLF
jgi:DNA modification methylase